VLSFHATKTFNTFEGGGIVAQDRKTKERIDYLKNFGFASETVVVGPGINGKMNEVQAAFGLLQLDYFESVVAARKRVADWYQECLAGLPGISLLEIPPNVRWNYSYYPIFVEQEFPLDRDSLYEKLKDNGIFARRYFYPLISEFPIYRALPSAARANIPVAYNAARKVLCLPIYPDLSREAQGRVIEIIGNCRRA
jgi:dTDP-4-amino-4,6-dideoxygalactose transaminase